jgi:hypothetical protein
VATTSENIRLLHHHAGHVRSLGGSFTRGPRCICRLSLPQLCGVRAVRNSHSNEPLDRCPVSFSRTARQFPLLTRNRTSDMANCAGILGPRMVILQNLTQPVGKGSVFSIDNFCDARRLDVYTSSSDLLGFFNSGGDGTLVSCINNKNASVSEAPCKARRMQPKLTYKL